MCFCNTGQETAEHFLLRCPLYILHRCHLLFEVLKVTDFSILCVNYQTLTNILLYYGDTGFSKDVNLKILNETLTYIKNQAFCEN